ncbi:MAG: hypothetical protein RL148_2107 [Planctomycetota bacterium]|jgi:nitroreductase
MTSTANPSIHIGTGQLLEQLRWRYATKKFDATRKIPAATWHALEESLCLAPSSFGLQPWKFVVVDHPDLRKQLMAVSWNQAQVVDASHLVVFTVKKGVGPADANKFADAIISQRGLKPEQVEPYRKMMLGFLQNLPAGFDVDGWSARQVYIAIGQFMASAAALGLDTCPMEGLDPAAYDRILGLEAKGLHTLCAMPVGYRHPDDAYAKLAKVRYPLAEIVEHV